MKNNNPDEQDPPAMVTCDWCGKEFPADARAFQDAGFSMFEMPDDDSADAWRGEQLGDKISGFKPEEIPKEQLAQMQEEMGLSAEQMEELLRTGSVTSGAACVCLECQDAAIEDEN